MIKVRDNILDRRIFLRIRLFNARILTLDNSFEIIEGEVWIFGNKISYVGEKKVSEEAFDREIDVQKNLVMPGFKNMHTHSTMTFLRSYADDLPLLDWLEKQVFPMEAKLKAEHVYAFSKLAIMEYLTSGITTNFDMYFHPEEIARASIDTGFRTFICGGISNFYSNAKELEDNYEKFNNYHELIGFKLGFHAEYTATPELLKNISDVAKRKKAPVFTHNSESKREVDDCIKRTGMTPTKYLNEFGMFDYGGGGFHCVHLSDEDKEIITKNEMFVITNPGSNVKLASGIADIDDLAKRGIKVAIGTDGPASNNCLDMFREMFLATGLQKLKNNDASSLDAYKVLEMATKNGAHVVGMSNADSIKENNLADLIIIDLMQPNMQPLNNIAKNIVYSGSKQNVKLTMINGKILYEDGKFNIGVNPEDIYKEVNDMVQVLKK